MVSLSRCSELVCVLVIVDLGLLRLSLFLCHGSSVRTRVAVLIFELIGVSVACLNRI